MYDLIGDIRGYASELKALLAKMDYQEINGIWQHPERKVIFLGDFVDRGPEQVETVQIARSMVESDNALAVMGNHEFNAVAWATPDPKNPGDYLRSHTDKNQDQHQAFLDQVSEGSDLHQSMVEWFKTLPVGHYWMSGEPVPLSDHIACLDCSVVGESILKKDKSSWVKMLKIRALKFDFLMLLHELTVSKLLLTTLAVIRLGSFGETAAVAYQN
ncbi:Calcineurin-like phosphoesterase [Marinobacter antarcticus]|uniref:Calcineurin-like phosphoesterase n=1 Tax=Marinobacter antarcticus TaxID=564117 RepID=A0A1M6U7D8_9GAMM|nr:metallophosphoesterase [Marinobacter antarcticus]SHK65107.1 Calcineurin-like phosphoesterase [Marinobacter antarcticus]